MSFSKHFTSPRLALSLAAALLQGLLLLWLHTRIQDEAWPATDSSWLAALYAVGIAIPITLHLLSEHWRSAAFWWAMSAMAALLFYFGWHFGAQVSSPLSQRHIEEDAGFVFGLSLGLLWLLFLPFLRARLVNGRWRCSYSQLFALAWQNKLALAEAALFTGVLWLLMHLWAVLFKTLGYDFFESFFEWPGFVYPFTAVAFGIALYLVGSVERIVTVAREQLLGLLKWLTPVAALILALFAPTLLFKLPGLVFSGEHAIGAAWLLWLLAVTVLLLNAGYQNGLSERPYPPPLALALRVVVPAMMVVATIALYALYVRVSEYGITVERVFAIVVGLTAFTYSSGYTLAALRRGPWLQGIERVNIGVAIGLMAIIALMLTPIASPYRFAAASQSARAREGIADFKARNSALRYLRFEAGRYGLRALERLAGPKGAGRSAPLQAHAAQVLKLRDRSDPDEAAAAETLAHIEVFPSGRRLDPGLERAMQAYLKSEAWMFNGRQDAAKAFALFVDLDADSTDECVLLYKSYLAVFARRDKRWTQAASGHASDVEDTEAWRAALASGDFGALTPQWQDLRIGKHRLPIEARAAHQK
jgi:hypothetical protein